MCRVGKKKKQEKLKKQKDREEVLRHSGADPEIKKKSGKKKSEKKKTEKKITGQYEAAGIRPAEIRESGPPETESAADRPANRTQRPKRRASKAAAGGQSSAAERFRALGDENRLRILTLLRDGPLCAGDLLKSLNIVQSTLSHHMKTLVETDLVKCRKQGKWSYYTINSDRIPDLDALLKAWS